MARAARVGRAAGTPALARVLHRLLGRGLGDRDALQADRKPRLVHHGEHARHAAILLADEETDGAALVAIDHRAGGRGAGAELVPERMGAHVVAWPRRA